MKMQIILMQEMLLYYDLPRYSHIQYFLAHKSIIHNIFTVPTTRECIIYFYTYFVIYKYNDASLYLFPMSYTATNVKTKIEKHDESWHTSSFIVIILYVKLVYGAPRRMFSCMFSSYSLLSYNHQHQPNIIQPTYRQFSPA